MKGYEAGTPALLRRVAGAVQARLARLGRGTRPWSGAAAEDLDLDVVWVAHHDDQLSGRGWGRLGLPDALLIETLLPGVEFGCGDAERDVV